MQASALYSPADIRRASFWIGQYRADWQRETPMKMHSWGVDSGHGLGGPPFHPEFEHWLGQICFCGRPPDPATGERGCPSNPYKKNPRNPDQRLRTTRAFRKLRKVAPREFDALYLLCAHQLTFRAVVDALNLRAIRLEKPEHYDEMGVLILLMSGLDKINSWY